LTPVSDAEGHEFDMKSVIRKVAVAVALSLSLGSAQSSEKPAEVSTDQMADRLWIQDLDFFESELAKRHKNLFFKISREELSRMVEELKTQIPDLDDYEITVSMMRIMESIGDSHTMLGTNFTGLFRKLPVLTEWYSGGLYVVRTVPEYREMLGKRVLGIEDHGIEDISRMIGTVIPHDNDAQLKTRGPHHLAIPEILAALGVVDSPDTVIFKLESSGDVSVTPQPFDSKTDWISVLDSVDCELPLYLQNHGLHYWFSYIEAGNLLYTQYSSCREMKAKPFASFTEELFSFIDSHPVDKFVLDMRSNNGGNSALARPLIDGLKQRESINKKGHLFALVGRKTFSSAILNALEFKKETNAIFVGEPTGGKPNHYGEVRFFTLPNSRITIQYSTKYFTQSPEDAPSLYPDINVDMSFSDFISCKDSVLQTVIDYTEVRD
jgi:hypothetical protein